MKNTIMKMNKWNKENFVNVLEKKIQTQTLLLSSFISMVKNYRYHSKQNIVVSGYLQQSGTDRQ